jgi:hypothetical protein
LTLAKTQLADSFLDSFSTYRLFLDSVCIIG